MQFTTKYKKSFYNKATHSQPILFKPSQSVQLQKFPTFLANMKKLSANQLSQTEASDTLGVVEQGQIDTSDQNSRFIFKDQCQTFWSIDQKNIMSKGLQKDSRNYKSGVLDYKGKLQSGLNRVWSINCFKMIKQIGNGAYGKVYLAEQKRSRMLFAIKVIFKESVRINKVQELVFRQIKIHLNQHHNNIVKLYHVFDDLNNIYLIQQYIGDGNLYEIIKNRTYRKLSERRISKYIDQLIKAVNHLHLQNIMHRDIKLQNVLIKDNIIKLCDFGCAVQTLDLRSTKLGSLGYFSPQKLKDQLYSNKADIWSIGVITYQLFFGKGPFEKDIVQIIQKGGKNHQLSQLIFPRKIQEQAEDFLSRMLEKNPQKRISLEQALKHPFITKYKQIQCKTTDKNYF